MKFTEEEVKANIIFASIKAKLVACLPSDFSTKYTLRYKRTQIC